jgi:hypothetical protein
MAIALGSTKALINWCMQNYLASERQNYILSSVKTLIGHRPQEVRMVILFKVPQWYCAESAPAYFSDEKYFD